MVVRVAICGIRTAKKRIKKGCCHRCVFGRLDHQNRPLKHLTKLASPSEISVRLEKSRLGRQRDGTVPVPCFGRNMHAIVVSPTLSAILHGVRRVEPSRSANPPLIGGAAVMLDQLLQDQLSSESSLSSQAAPQRRFSILAELRRNSAPSQ